MKPRPPTLRDKRRYLLVGMRPRGRMSDPKKLYYAIHGALTALWGDAACAKIQMAVISREDDYLVIRCRRGTEHLLEGALATVTQVNGERIALDPLATSGTIRALRRRMRPALPVVLGEEIEVGGCAMTPARYSGQKVDLFAKGIKNQESLYFTHFDLEEY